MGINLPNGANVEEIVLPDGSNASEVIGPDGSTLWERNAIPDEGVARWTFDDSDTGSGAAIDIWNGNDATINGATTGESGANQTYTTNEAYYFDGSDYVDTPLSFSKDDFSYAAWVNFDSFTSESYNDIIDSYDTTRDQWARIAANEGDFAFRVDNNGDDEVIGPSISTGQWYHVVGTRSGDTIELYVDGSSEGASSNLPTGTINTSNEVIGARGDSSGSNEQVNGTIDDVRIYSKALSSTEVADLYNTGSI